MNEQDLIIEACELTENYDTTMHQDYLLGMTKRRGGSLLHVP